MLLKNKYIDTKYMSTNTEQLYEQLLSHVKLLLHRPYNAAKVITLVAAGVKFAEQFTQLNGPQKKDLVIRAIRDCISSNVELTEDERAALITILDTVGDSAIDTLVEFGKDAKTFIKDRCASCGKCNIL